MLRSLVTLAVLVAALAPSALAQARLVCDPPKIHLGTVYYGSSIEGSVQLVNAGNEPLVITDVKSSCGCTAAALPASSKTIAPGQRVTLPITMTPKGPSTPLRKRVNIVSNDPETRVTSIEVSCDVREGVVSDPGFLLFQNLDVGDAPTRTMTFTSKNGVPFQITNITFTTPLWRATWNRSATPALSHTVQVSAGPIQTRTVPSSLMLVQTTHPQTPRLRINANAQVLPVIQMTPQRLVYPATAPGASASVTMRLIDRDTNGPVRVLSASLMNELRYDVEAVQDTRDPLSWNFTVKVPADELRPRLSAMLSLMTDRQTVTVPLLMPITR